MTDGRYFDDAEYERRRHLVREQMSQRGLDALVIASPENIYYLSGLDHMGYFAVQLLILPAKGQPILITRAMEKATVRDQVPDLVHVGYTDGTAPPPVTEDDATTVDEPWAMTVGAPTREYRRHSARVPSAAVRETVKTLHDAGLAKSVLAIDQRSTFLPYVIVDGLMDSTPEAEWEDIGSLVDDIRIVQSPEELALTRQAAAISDSMMLSAIAAAGTGMNAREIMAAIYDAMFRRGGTYPGLMLTDFPDLDALVVPVGGGGLIAGNAVAAKALKPDIELIGVQTRRFPAMKQALAGQPAHCGPATIAEGIAVKEPGALTLPLVRQYVRDIALVDESDIEQAILMLLEIEKTVVEGAGAAGLAAILTHSERFRGRRVGLILCGGNIDLLPLSSVIQRGLARSKRVVRVRVGVPDVPGALADLTRLLADHNANVIQISHQRAFTDLSLRSVEVEVTYETLGGDHNQRILDALRHEGYDPVVPESEPHPDEWRPQS